MKLLLITFCFLLIFSCQKEKTLTPKPTFLIGDWVRVNDKEDSMTYETWNANLKGVGYTLKEKDTVFKETLSIVNVRDTLFLKVTGVHKNAIFFKFTHQTASSFTCENAKNEFPKIIKYYLEKKTA